MKQSDTRLSAYSDNDKAIPPILLSLARILDGNRPSSKPLRVLSCQIWVSLIQTTFYVVPQVGLCSLSAMSGVLKSSLLRSAYSKFYHSQNFTQIRQSLELSCS